nr:MAG TPA: hypothetical protein [Caudoviricetes sp.]
MRREWLRLSWLYKTGGVPSLYAERGCAPPVICNIPRFFLNKSVLHRHLSRQDVFFIYAGRRLCYKICENSIFIG